MNRSLILALLFFLLGPLSQPPCAEAAGSGAADGAAGSMSIMLDLNAATYDQLLSVRGIGPALATRILEARTRRGSFARLEELLEIEGIGEKSLARLRGYLTLPSPPSPDLACSPFSLRGGPTTCKQGTCTQADS